MQRAFLRTIVAALALALVLPAGGCFWKKKKAAATAPRTTEEAGTPVFLDDEGEVLAPTPIPAGPPPTPADARPAYSDMEEPIFYPGADIRNETRNPGAWSVGLGVDASAQEVVAYYRKEAKKRGWKEVDFQPLGPGGFITWETENGHAQLVAGKRSDGGTNVELGWSARQ